MRLDVEPFVLPVADQQRGHVEREIRLIVLDHGRKALHLRGRPTHAATIARSRRSEDGRDCDGLVTSADRLVLLRHLGGMGRHSMISTESPGKIVKCGWFSNNFAAAS